MPEELQIRIAGDASLPTVVYLPGVHGDWTLISSFRQALGQRARLVEITYPRTVRWSLPDYAAETEAALRAKGITRGWLLGESFSSQVVWSILARASFQTEGIILAGGFARYPIRWGVRIAEWLCGSLPLCLVKLFLSCYARAARFRFRRAPETLAGIQEFISRRTEPDRQAMKHRLHLIAGNDPRPIVQQTCLPLYALSGLFDPVVPWMFVRPWIVRHCPALREYKIIWRADHNVLSTAPGAAAECVLRWIAEARRAQRDAPQGAIGRSRDPRSSATPPDRELRAGSMPVGRPGSAACSR